MKSFLREVYKPLIVFIIFAVLFYGSIYALVYFGHIMGII